MRKREKNNSTHLLPSELKDNNSRAVIELASRAEKRDWG